MSSAILSMSSINDGKINQETSTPTSTGTQTTIDILHKADSEAATLQEDLKRLEEKRSILLQRSLTITQEFEKKYPDLKDAQSVERASMRRLDAEKRMRVVLGMYTICSKASQMILRAHEDRLRLQREKRDADRAIKSNEAAIARTKFLIRLESKKRKAAEAQIEASKKARND